MQGELVTLSRTETEEAYQCGQQRYLNSAFRGDRNRMANQSLAQNIGSHIVGALGERAVYKALGRQWVGTVDTFKAPDLVGTQVQIRTTSKSTGELVVRERDNPDQPFVLVVPEEFPAFRVVGWCYGKDARKREFWKAPRTDLPPAYFVPQHLLQPIDTLPLDPSSTQQRQQNSTPNGDPF